MNALHDLLRAADEARRQQGAALDRLGFGPHTTPSRPVRRSPAGDLLAYQAANERQPAVLIVPAPIKTAYIWDLAPGRSVVQRLRATDVQVYLLAWQRPQPRDNWMGLAQYADRAISDCLEAIENETGAAKIFVTGHSLGGTLAAIFSSLHPDRLHGLIELEGPMEFGAGRLETAMAGGPPASAVTGLVGNVPGSLLDWMSVWADPFTFSAEPWLDWLQSSRSADERRLHWQVRRWALDETPIARQLFEEVEEELYRRNRFAEGELRIDGRPARPQAIEAPIVAILDRRSRIVPPPSVEAYRSRTGSSDVQILDYPGDTGVLMQHVGVLVGERAHKLLWPSILQWIEQRLPQAA